MKLLKCFSFALILNCLALSACKNVEPGVSEPLEKEYVKCPSEIRLRAFEFATLYAESETEYLYGGQEPLRAIKIDCSGLVIMSYKYALVDTLYALPLPDMSSSYMYEKASYSTDSPGKGDLIFMGEENSSKVSHIAIYEKEENGEVYFIDSTENDFVSGVSFRHYPKDSKKIKGFGVMKICKLAKSY